MKEELLLSAKEAAQRFGVSLNFLYRHAKELPHYRVGIQLKFSEQELRQYFKQEVVSR
jgi:excisionase family DNA binding protein